MSKRLIGYGYTNANGVATLDYDAEGNELQSSGYVGQGVGNVDISASAVIDGSTFVSETYDVLDCLAFDNATSDSHNDAMWQDNNQILKRDTDYSYLDGALWNSILLKINNSTTLPFNNGMCIELDVLESSGATRIVVSDGTNRQFVWGTSDPYADTGHFKFTIKDGEFRVQIDNGSSSKISDFDTTVSTFTCNIQLYTGFQSFKFKNFKIYPI